jgi:predicted ATP-grasp superfamily ATP-dependent carboligase
MRLDHPGRVLVFGDDMRIFLAVVRAFGRSGKIVHAVPFDSRSPALKSKFISTVHAIPNPVSDPAGWKTAVVKLLQSVSFDLIVPCTDPAIIAFDSDRRAFSGHNIAIPNADAMPELFDKEETHRLCERLGIPVSPAARLRPADTAAELLNQYGLPMVIKPRRTYWAGQLEAWGKVEIVENEARLTSVLAGLEDRSRYLVESYFEGIGVGVSVLSKEGVILQAFQHRRLREGNGGASSYRISEPVSPELRQACEKICKAANHTGVCMFEFRYNLASGRWVLLETNARFWGSMALPLSLGIDFPNLLYDLQVRHVSSAEKPYAASVRSRNFMLDGNNLLKCMYQIRPSNLAGWMADVIDFALQPIRWLNGKERSDSFVHDDLRPAFWECVLLLHLKKKTTRPWVKSSGTIPASLEVQ